MSSSTHPGNGHEDDAPATSRSPQSQSVDWRSAAQPGPVLTGLLEICNSWGADWGDGGNCIMTDELFGGHLLGDVYAVRAALPFSE